MSPRTTLTALTLGALCFLAPAVQAGTDRPVSPSATPAQAGDVSADGWRDLGSGYRVFVGAPQGVPKTRAEVLAELIEWQRHPVHPDGVTEVGGHSGYYVFRGQPSTWSDQRVGQR